MVPESLHETPLLQMRNPQLAGGLTRSRPPLSRLRTRPFPKPSRMRSPDVRSCRHHLRWRGRCHPASQRETRVPSGVVEVDFRIDQAVRGCSSRRQLYLERVGRTLAGRETNACHVGQRLLMMLHSPGPTGITSPVAGLDGAIPAACSEFDSSRGLFHFHLLPTILPASSFFLPTSAGLGRIFCELPPSPQRAARHIRMTADAVPVADVQQTPLSTVVGMLNSWQQSSGNRLS